VFLTQPSYVKFWQDMAVEPHLKRPEVPTLEVGGYWDQEDMWGTQAEYAALRPHEKPGLCIRCSWCWGRGIMVDGRVGGAMSWAGSLGRLRLAGRRRGIVPQDYEAPFFEKYLKGKPGFDLEDTASFRTGENKWHTYAMCGRRRWGSRGAAVSGGRITS
jgi:predicted acyl esterase